MKKGNIVKTHLLLAVIGALVAATAGLILVEALPSAADRAIEQAFS